MKHLKTQQQLNEASENLNISDVISGKLNGKVTEIGQKFTVKLPTQIMRDSKFWKEGKVYTCTNIVEFDRLDSEIYVDNNWISDSFTTVV